jgi:phosphoribosyl 1,2-cyclic phosphodiesterase
MKLRFWGVRGSIPCPGSRTVKYGGNSACLELRIGGDSGRIIVIDAGTGIRELGNYLMKHDLPQGPMDIDLFLSHTHWDHIMGFPYFTPIYIPGTRLRVYGPVSFEDDPLQDVVGGQMKYRYFPVNVGELASTIDYIRLREDPGIDLGDGLVLTTKILNHPILALGYRFEYRGKVLCTCYDTEPFRNLFITDPAHPDYDEAMAYEGQLVAEEQNQIVEQFFAGADLLIHDAQYTETEYAGKIGWGHSTYEQALAAAGRAGVKRLALFHHDPDRTDDQLDALAETYCRPGAYGDMEVFFAREGPGNRSARPTDQDRSPRSRSMICRSG